jgi:hypothetical protein
VFAARQELNFERLLSTSRFSQRRFQEFHFSDIMLRHQLEMNHISEEQVASIFRAERISQAINQLPTSVMLVYLAYSQTLKMEAICSFENSVDF